MKPRKLQVGDVVALRTREGWRLATIDRLHPMTAVTTDGAELNRSRPSVVALRSPLPERDR